VPGQWTVSGHNPLEDFVIYSHRGAGELLPENTIAAFQKGWEMGTVPEADMRTTRDGVIVAFHDPTFKRTVKSASAELKKKGVPDLTFAELSKLDVGLWKGEQFQGLRVPRLAEVLDLMRGQPKRRLCLDFKYVDLRQLAKEAGSHGVEKQVVLATTDYAVIRQWKKLLPDYQTMLWMGEPEDKLKERLAN
jgi:glycerophosphoryl diester phosphodiesterase